MSYTVVFTKAGAKEFARLPREAQKRLAKRIDELAVRPTHNAIQLRGVPGVWRTRVGEYRILYEVHVTELIVSVIHTGHRRDIYKRIKR